MVDGYIPSDLAEKRVHEWLLTLLRFAVTHDPADQLEALVHASELDCNDASCGLTFFQRTSAAVCRAIIVCDKDGERILRQHVARIEEPRLRKAFIAATDIQKPPSERRHKAHDRFRSQLLWKGLRNP